MDLVTIIAGVISHFPMAWLRQAGCILVKLNNSGDLHLPIIKRVNNPIWEMKEKYA